jgi:hypothetical protein
MDKCNDYWCEHYNKAHSNCDRCEKQHNKEDKPYQRVIFQNRAVNQMEIDEKHNDRGQRR